MEEILLGVGDLYEHYKGGRYRIILQSTDEETGEPLVTYKSEQDGKLWTRKLRVFLSDSGKFSMDREGNLTPIPRFRRIDWGTEKC